MQGPSTMNRTVRNVFESLYDFLCQIFTLVFALVGKLGGTAASSTMMAALSSRSSLRFEGSGITVTYSSDSLLGSDSVLGEGAFSTVFTAKDVFSDKQYAVKKMFLQSEDFERAYAEEVSSFLRWKHPFVMTLIDHYASFNTQANCKIAYLLFPLKRGTLRDQLNDTVLVDGYYSNSDGRSRLVSTLTQYLKICNAFNMLHTHTPAAYVHQDVKPENILISAPSCTSYTDSTGRARVQYSSFSSSSSSPSPSPSSSYVDNMNNSSDSSAHGMMMMADDDVEGGTFSGNSNGNSSSSSGGSGTDKWYGGHGEPLLTDFGSVRLADVSITSRTDSLRVADEAAQFCTVSYRAPELFDPPKGSTLDTRTDVWGLGCLLFCMWFGYSPYECTFMQGVIKVADCSHSRVLSKMPRKSTQYCSPEDEKILDLSEWILTQDFTERVYTSDIITAIEEELAALR